MPSVRVVVAVVLRRGRGTDLRVLVSWRLPGAHLGACWEFPGGKALPGESDEECALREVEEETGVRVAFGGQLAEARHDEPGRTVRIRFVLCWYVDGVPEPRACRAVRWVRPENLEVYDFPEANRSVLAWLRAGPEGLPAAIGPGEAGPRGGNPAGP